MASTAIAGSASDDVELQSINDEGSAEAQAGPSQQQPSSSAPAPDDASLLAAFWKERLPTSDNLKASFNVIDYLLFKSERRFFPAAYPKTSYKDIYAGWPKDGLVCDKSYGPVYVVKCFHDLEHQVIRASDFPIDRQEPPIGVVYCSHSVLLDDEMRNLDFDALAAFYCFFRPNLDNATGRNVLGGIIPTFLKAHLGIDEYRDGSLFHCTGKGRQCYFHYRLRHFSYFDAKESYYDEPNPSGIRCHRDNGVLSSPDGEFAIRQEITSVIFLIDLSKAGAFVITIFHDSPDAGERIPKEASKSHYGADGILFFQDITMSLLQYWHERWIECLGNLDKLLITKVRDVTKPETLERLMYDNDKLHRSELYFSVLQILRIFSTSIKEDISQLKDTMNNARKECETVIKEFADIQDLDSTIPILGEKWKSINEKLESSESDLIGRIDRQIEDIKSLRDGLFNAMAVREAVKGRQLNRYLFIFTIITIIFTPPSFVATFYGMHLFDGVGSIEDTQKGFWKVFGGITAVTYTLGLLAITSFSWSKWWPDIKNIIMFVSIIIRLVIRWPIKKYIWERRRYPSREGTLA